MALPFPLLLTPRHDTTLHWFLQQAGKVPDQRIYYSPPKALRAIQTDTLFDWTADVKRLARMIVRASQ